MALGKVAKAMAEKARMAAEKVLDWSQRFPTKVAGWRQWQKRLRAGKGGAGASGQQQRRLGGGGKRGWVT